MKVLLNGEQAEIAQKVTVHGLLEAKNIKPASVVVELNGKILERDTFPIIQINEADKIEIISFVGGG